MKRLFMQDLLRLSIFDKEEHTWVSINNEEFILKDNKLWEEYNTLTSEIAKEIESKYEKVVNENGQKVYKDEDLDKVREEIKKYEELREVVVVIKDKDIMEEIKSLLAK